MFWGSLETNELIFNLLLLVQGLGMPQIWRFSPVREKTYDKSTNVEALCLVAHWKTVGMWDNGKTVEPNVSEVNHEVWKIEKKIYINKYILDVFKIMAHTPYPIPSQPM